MEVLLMRERSAVRLIPRNAITVAIENEGYPLAYGVVANISEAGACLWTNGAFHVGESLVLRLSFPHEPQPVQAVGRVVWEDADRDEQGALRYGLFWTPSGPHTSRLQGLIDATARADS
jgi:Tfp pilus assembly protein PilZ